MRPIDGDALEKKLRNAINMGMSINTSGLAELNAVLSDVETMPTIEPARRTSSRNFTIIKSTGLNHTMTSNLNHNWKK